MEPRLIAAFAIIATSGTGIVAAIAAYLPRRRREKLRRRGIKTLDR